MSQGEWYAGSPELNAYGRAGALQRAGRFQGHFEADSGTLQVLDVKGRLKFGDKGVSSAGQTAYNQGAGWWMEYAGGTPRLSIGNSAGNNMTWDGAALSITGSLTSTAGQIAGWAIGASALSGGNASLNSGGFLNLGTANDIVRADAADATYRLWVGNAAAASAPFRVTKAGALTSSGATITGTITANAGTIGGWTASSTALSLGSGATARGMDSGSVAFYAGSATPASAPFRVSTAGALTATSATITGAITATSGELQALTLTGTLTLSGSGKIVDADGSEWSQSGIILKSAGVYGDTIRWQSGGTDKGTITADASGISLQGGSAASLGGGLACSSPGSSTSFATAYVNIRSNAIWASTKDGSVGHFTVELGDAGGVTQFRIFDTGGMVFGINSDGELIHPQTNDATALGAYYGRVPIWVGGALRYFGVYN